MSTKCPTNDCENRVETPGLRTDCRLSLNNRPQGQQQYTSVAPDPRNTLERLLGIDPEDIRALEEHVPDIDTRLHDGFAWQAGACA